MLSAILAAGLTRESAPYQRAVFQHGGHNGKHNGRTPGAFGGGARAKCHRALYVKSTAGVAQ